MNRLRRQIVFGLPALISGGASIVQAQAQKSENNPLAVDPAKPIAAGATRDLVLFNDATRRRIPVRIRMPRDIRKTGLIVYSPGLGSGIGNGASWCEAWRNAGFVVATLAHPGTDDQIWNTGSRSLRVNLSNALAASQYALRVSDCRFVIQQCLETLGIEAFIDAAAIGIAGHSFGAFTVETMAAQAKAGRAAPQIGAAIALSPGGRATNAAGRVSGIRIPYFCVTGDRDNHVTFGSGADAMKLGVPLPNRLAVYESLPKGAKQLLVLARADHMTFAGETVSSRQFSRDVPHSDRDNAAAWSRVNHATTEFWLHYLKGGGSEPREQYLARIRTGLDPADRLEAG